MRDFSVLKKTSLRHDTSNTSACLVMARTGSSPRPRRMTGSSRRISAAVACQASMSANASGVMKSDRGSVEMATSVMLAGPLSPVPGPPTGSGLCVGR